MRNIDNESIIILNDEDGNDLRFEFLDLIQYKGNEYVVLLPLTDSDKPGEVVILMIEGRTSNTDTESYIGISDEPTRYAVFAIFKEHFKDEFNFVEEEIALDQEKSNAFVTCPNCGGTHMIECGGLLETTDTLERFCLVASTFTFSSFCFSIIRWIFKKLGWSYKLTLSLSIFLWIVLIGLGLWLSYNLISQLSSERYLNDVVSVWYVKCNKCHRKYRIVRPYGSPPPCETLPKEDEEDDTYY